MADNENMNIEDVQVVRELPVEKSLLAVTLQTGEDQEPDEEYETIAVRELETVKLGRQGENDTQTVVIDCSEWLTKLPGCTLMIAATRPGEREVYLPEVTVDGGVVTWPILEQDTALSGYGRAEVRAMKDGKIKKSALFKTRIEPALENDARPDAPTPPNWVKVIIGSVETAEEAATTAQAQVQGAEEAATAAQEAAEAAQAAAEGAVRYNAAQTLTDAEKAQARENIGAVAVDQGAANAGKALVVGTDGSVTVGDAGIPEAVKAALLDLARHVAYADENGRTYYSTLREALYGGSVDPDPIDPDPVDTDQYDWSLEDLSVIRAAGTLDASTGEVWANVSGAGENVYKRRMIGTATRVNDAEEIVDYVTREGLGAYPIYVPRSATKVTITANDPDYKVGAERYVLNDGKYSRIDGGFAYTLVGEGISQEFEAASNSFVIVVMAKGSTNQETFDDDEPTSLEIHFE